MPFRKVGPDTYVSPSGRKYTQAQVIAYYASGGKFDKAKKKVRKKRKKK